MDLVATAALEKSSHFCGMGPEPLGAYFSPAALHAALKYKAAPIKSALLDQRVVAGLGNIYVCEALFRAGVSPRKKAKNISLKAAARLHRQIAEVLAEAIDAGGSSLKDFAALDGALGYFQHHFKVYGREGEPCPICGRGIRRITQSGRSTFYCGACQK
jgi:formamidopyrimidine-DNA glycosylase